MPPFCILIDPLFDAHTTPSFFAHTMFLRSASRAVARSAAIPSTASRAAASPMACLNAQKKSIVAPQQQTRAASEHAIANPTLAGIEKRWEAMPPQEQADLWMQLRDRMKVDWHQMTVQEKKAGMFYMCSGWSRWRVEVYKEREGECIEKNFC